MNSAYHEFALLLLLLSAVAGAIAVRLRQSLLMAYIIIVKLLSDKRELDSLHGRIAVGFLIVQDLAVVIAMMVMSGLGGIGGEAVDGTTLALSLLARLGGAGLMLYVLTRFVLPRVVAQPTPT
jgi:predicted Kef-type K+ transport protein